MTREEYRKQGGDFVKERRKIRRNEVNRRALDAYEAVLQMLGPYVEQVEGRSVDASARHSDSTALTAILKFGRRFSALETAAFHELERRYAMTQHGRRVDRVVAEMTKGFATAPDLKAQIEERKKELRRQFRATRAREAKQ